jgi:hypothetical protein
MSSLPGLESLDRSELLAIAHEYMLSGMLVTKAVVPVLGFRSGLEAATVTDIGILEWMGASPIYTGRLRSLMGIEGDDIAAIMKALQLDVGFVHQYMDVAYSISDSRHGEFWLRHCGALLDVEPFGEDQVFNMCHTIEDPTFDATALATNRRARIRPIHRPPRRPADRHPHCHWTITIDPEAEEVGAIPLNAQVSALPLARLQNPQDRTPEPGLRADYAGPFEPEFRLQHLTTGTLAAATREFHIQAHLLVASIELAMREHLDNDQVADIMAEAWLGAAWIAAERLARLRNLAPSPTGVQHALALTPMLPPGFTRAITVDDNRVRCRLTPVVDGLLDPRHPGWCGALARGVTTGLEGTVRGLGLGVEHASLTIDSEGAHAELSVGPADPGGAEPDVVSIGRIGRTAAWTFSLSQAGSP